MHGLQKILADTTNAGEKRIGTGGKTGMTVEVYSMFVNTDLQQQLQWHVLQQHKRRKQLANCLYKYHRR